MHDLRCEGIASQITCSKPVVCLRSIGYLIPIKPKKKYHYCICISNVTCGFVSLGEQSQSFTLSLSLCLSCVLVFVPTTWAQGIRIRNTSSPSVSLSSDTAMTTVQLYHPWGPSGLGVSCSHSSCLLRISVVLNVYVVSRCVLCTQGLPGKEALGLSVDSQLK